MDQTEYLAFAQLWEEEKELLYENASLVPNNGTIVEIGTAQGGSAFIFSKATANRGVDIHSFDIAPSKEAYENLKDTNVKIIAKSSKEGAKDWKETGGKSIDLLFIDGSHALQHLFEDFNSWAPFLKPGGRIIFHDYDSIERGGLVHLGVNICINTILRCKLLSEPDHKYKLLMGKVQAPEKTRLYEASCYETLADMGREIKKICDLNYSKWSIVDTGEFTEVLKGSVKPPHHTNPILPEEAVDPNKKYLICARPLESALDALTAQGIPKGSIVPVSNLQLCYITEKIFQENREYLLSIAKSRKDFFRWEEKLFMFEHAFGASTFPSEMPGSYAKSDIVKISQTVAREQIRLTILSYLAESICGDKL